MKLNKYLAKDRKEVIRFIQSIIPKSFKCDFSMQIVKDMDGRFYLLNDKQHVDHILKIKLLFLSALVQDYNVSLSGGGESGNYYVSAGYYNNDGVSYGNSFNRYSFRVNTTGKRGWFSFGENLAYSLTNKDPLQTNPYNDVMRMMPTIPVYDENNPGGYGYGDAAKYNTFGTNPIARENLEEMEERQNRISSKGIIFSSISITIASWIIFIIHRYSRHHTHDIIIRIGLQRIFICQ
jgi:hypothetical protein